MQWSLDGSQIRGSPQHGVAIAEIGTDHQMYVVKLPRHQPAVVAPLGQPIPRGAAYARQILGQTSHVIDLYLPGLPSFIWPHASPTCWLAAAPMVDGSHINPVRRPVARR
jgi:hypothetical protein